MSKSEFLKAGPKSTNEEIDKLVKRHELLHVSSMIVASLAPDKDDIFDSIEDMATYSVVIAQALIKKVDGENS